MSYYVLIGKIVVTEPDLIKWACWFQLNNRSVAEDLINGRRVSTVFLGVDHNFYGGKPILFETMTFPDCEICERYSTWEEAEAGHARVVQMLKLTEKEGI